MGEFKMPLSLSDRKQKIYKDGVSYRYFIETLYQLKDILLALVYPSTFKKSLYIVTSAE